MVRDTRLVLDHDHWGDMQSDVLSRLPEEACGLLGGTGESVEIVIPITNHLHSPEKFRMEPTEQLKAFQLLESRDLELVGIYHSHPHGPDSLSSTDILEAYYPDVVHLIWSNSTKGWRCRGFRIFDREVREVRIERR